MMEIQRPLDIINKSKGSKIIVEMKSGKVYKGVLAAWDAHPNLVLEDAEDLTENKKYAWIFLRGDSVMVIKPAE